MKKTLLVFGFVLALVSGCNSVSTENIPAVENFNVTRYLGMWYEIARLPHSFEDGLSRVSATYYMQSNGRIKVVNRGYDTAKNKHKKVEGEGELVRRSDVGELKVTFFRPFYGAYRVIVLAPDYSYAMVTSGTTDYLWILSRTPTLPPETLKSLTDQAQEFGFDTTRLIYADGQLLR